MDRVADVPRLNPDALPGEQPYVAYGDGTAFFRWLEGDAVPPRKEIIFEGVAGCGKTRLLCEFWHRAAERWPRRKFLWFRKTRVDLNDSVLDIFENEVLGPGHPVLLGAQGQELGRRNRASYVYPNGSEIVLAGMNQPTRMYSTQYHGAWCNEVQELAVEEWESIHRSLRRPGARMRHLLVGDCNPDTWDHWANQRCLEDDIGRVRAHRLIGRFWDNPRYYDWLSRTWTREGIEYLTDLRENLTGVRLMRLFYGLWVAAEGLIWPTYDPYKHLITAELEHRDDNRHILHILAGRTEANEPVWRDVRLEYFVAGMDFGFNAPGCMQVWGFDLLGHGYRVAEIYRTSTDLDDWGEWAAELWDEFRYIVGVADHEPATIRHLNRYCSKATGRGAPGGVWREWNKRRDKDGEKAGIDQVRVCFKRDELFLVRNAQRFGVDRTLREKHKPTCLEQEIPQYVYPTRVDGKEIKEEPDRGCEQHACDAARGVVNWVWLKDLVPHGRTEQYGREKYPPGTYGHWLKHADVERDIRQERRGTGRFRPARRRRRR